MMEDLTLTPFCFMRLANGGSQQEYINKKFGLHVKKIKENRDAKWRMEITCTAMPDKVFTSMEELRKAAQSNVNA